MSIFSNVIGKIPVVGHALNQVGKVLPSVGQIVGGAALGPVGAVIGGSLDPHTTSTQKTIGNTVAGAAGALGGAGLLGGLAGGSGGISLSSLLGGAGKLLTGGGGTSLSSLVNPALGVLQGVNAADLQKQSSQYAQNAQNAVQQSYDARAPLRTAGIAGMQNPTAGIDLSSLNKAAKHNPFAA